MDSKLQDLMSHYRDGDLSRREFMRAAGVLGLSISGMAAFLSGCSSDTTTTTAAGTATTAAGETTTTAAAGAAKRGGTIFHAQPPAQRMDPAFFATIGDDSLGRQWLEQLVFLDEDSMPDPERSLAESWEAAPDGKTYTFKIRQGVTFHDGKALTSADVKFSFDRLRDPDVGSAVVGLYANIASIDAPDDFTVVFNLTEPNPDFPLDLTDYHAKVVDSATTDFDTQFNGTGAFMLDTFAAGDRGILKPAPSYWMKGDDGQPLPYAAGLEHIFLDDPTAQVDALRGGQAHYLTYVSAEFAKPLQEDSAISVPTKTSNVHFAFYMRSDRGPAADVKVRQALRAATDRNALLQVAAQGFGSTGRDTPIGPAYGDFYLDVPEPARDIAKAKSLLADAGYADGLEITLTTQNTLKVPDMATIWKEQLAEAGVTVNIELVPVEVWYGADNLWLEADFGIVDWAPRAYPQPYLTLAYVTGAPWNSPHYSDPELDELAAKAGMELDRTKRIDYYHQIQEIFMDRGPLMVPYFADAIVAFRNEMKPGLIPNSAPDNIDVRNQWLDV